MSESNEFSKFSGKRHSILGLLPLFKVVEEEGYDPEVLLEKTGLDLNSMTGAALIDQALELELVADAIEMLNDPILGVKVGSQVSFTSYGTYVMLLLSANTLQDAVKAGEEFQSLSLLFSHMTLHFEPDWVEMRYAMPDVSDHVRHFVADRDLCGTFVFIREFLDEEELKFVEGGLARPKPDASIYSDYKRYVQFNVVYDQPYNWLRLPSRLLRTEQKHRNSWAHKLYRVQAYEMLRAFYPETEDFVLKVKQVLAGYAGKPPSVAQVSQMLGVSERTLRRKLDARQTSYRDLVEEQLRNRAFDMLTQHKLPVSEIADRLGFAESASFLRAFKRWTGQTPKQYAKKTSGVKQNG